MMVEAKRSGGHGWKLTEEQKNRAVKMYREGLKLDAIASEFSVTKQAISMLAKKRGIPRRRLGWQHG